MTVSDAMLGNRFWYSTDTAGLSRLLDAYAANRNEGAEKADINSKTVHDSTLTSFFLNGSNESVKRAINRAEAFVSSHVINPDAKLAEFGTAMKTAEKLGLDVESLIAEISTLMENDRLVDPEISEQARATLSHEVKIALVKLLVSNEFQERAAVIQDGRVVPLSSEGRDALRNAVVGLTNMLLKGAVSEDAVLYLANGKVHDLGNAADVLEIAARSAAKVKEAFIGKADIEAFKQALENEFAAFEASGNPAKVETVRAALNKLLAAANDLMKKREAMAAQIKTDFTLTDPNGKAKKDSSFQKAQIRQIRNSLRAFRYDLDLASGKKMEFRESIRRKFDDFSIHSRERITGAQFKAAQLAERSLNAAAQDLFGMMRDDMMAAPQVERMDDDPERKDSLLSRATAMSHETNNIIRYHFSGHERRQNDFAKSVHDAFDDLVKRGGSKQVSVKVGANFLMKLNLGALDAGLKLGGRFTVDAELSVKDPGGPITVTYRYGGEGVVGVNGKVGSSDASGGAEVGAEAALGGGHAVSVSYKNLDELIGHLNGETKLVQAKTFGGWVLGGVKKALKFVGHGIMLGLTGIGARIHKSRLDSAVYAAKLEQYGVFDKIDSFLSTRKNGYLQEKRQANDIRFTGEASAKGSVGDFLSLGGGANVSVKNELSAKARAYRSYISELTLLERDALEARFDQEAVKLLGSGPKQDDEKTAFDKIGERFESILNEVKDKTSLKESFAKILKARDEFEAEIGSVPDKDRTKDFWRKYAAVIRLGALTAMILEERAKSLGETEVAVQAHHLMEYLSQPVRELPVDVFEEEMTTSFYVQSSTERTISTGGEFTFDFGGDAIKDFGTRDQASPGSLGSTLQQVGVSALKGLGSATMSSVQQTIGAKTTVKFGMTKKVQTAPDSNVCPWKNINTTEIFVQVTASMPVRLLLDLIVDQVVRKVGGDNEAENQTLRTDLKDQLKDSLIGMGVAAGKNAVLTSLDMTLGALSEKIPFLKKLLPGETSAPTDVANGTPLSNVGIESGLEHFKTISLTFNNGWRLASFKLAETTESGFKVNLNAAAAFGFGVEFGFTTSLSKVNYALCPSPSLLTLLDASSSFVSSGNVESFKHFLSINQKGIFRFLDFMRLGVEIDPSDKKALKDREEANAIVNDAKTLLLDMQKRRDRLKNEADELSASLTHFESEMAKDHSDDPPAARLKLAREYLTTLTKVYMLAERCQGLDLAGNPQAVPLTPRSTHISNKWRPLLGSA